MDKILNCGIVGFGYMGEIRKRIVDSIEGLRLVGVCDTDKSVRDRLQDVEVFSCFEDMLDKDIDIVFVCTPNCFSPEISVKAMKAGKHVFCEKPPGRNIDDIKYMRQHEKDGVKLMFGFNHRYHPGIIKAKLIVDSGRLGGIIALRGVYGKSGGRGFHKSWRNKKEVSGGGILLDQGVHMLDLFRYFCGDFQDVKCFKNNLFWKFDIEDNAFVILRNSNGQMASLHSSATLWKHTFRLDIILEEGYMVIEGLLSKTGSYGRERLVVGKRQFEDEAEALGNPSEQITYFDKDRSWELEVSEFVRCIREDKPVTMSNSFDALRVMEIIQQAYNDAEQDIVEEVTDEKHCCF